MSSGRRSFHLSLPSSDPRSALILAWIDALPGDADVSAEMRRLFTDALSVEKQHNQIEQRLAHIEQLLASHQTQPIPLSATHTPSLDSKLLASLTTFDEGE